MSRQVEVFLAAFPHEASAEQVERAFAVVRETLAAEDALGKAVLLAASVLAPVPMPLEEKFRNQFMVDVLNALEFANRVESLRPAGWKPDFSGLYSKSMIKR